MEKAIDNGNGQIDLSKLSKEELRILQEKCEQGDPEACDQILRAHLPLVSLLAKKYCGRGVPYDDLYQEGCYGLLKGIKKYKCQFNASFATYFSYYILKYIKKAIISQNTLYPFVYKENFYYDLKKYMRAYNQLAAKLERPPSEAELADELNFTFKKIQSLRMSAHMFLYYPSRSHNRDMLQSSANLTVNSAEITYLETEHSLDLSSLDVKLTVREREVLSRKLGFTKSGTPESTASISADLGLSFETIRTTYLMALKKIRDAVEEKGIDLSTIEI